MTIKNIPLIYKIALYIKHTYLTYLAKKSLNIYLKSENKNYLQIGAGQNELKGWYNTDYFPRKNILFLDVTKKFQIPKESFEYVFSEHHIEHIHYKEANFMIKEIYRVLKKGGVLRVCTPDLKKYLNSYFSPTNAKDPFISDIMNNWIKKGFHNAKNFIPNEDDDNLIFFINDIFYNYEHKFIYDEVTLINLLISNGFSHAYACKPSKSVHKELNGIESHVGITMPFTLTIEAIK